VLGLRQYVVSGRSRIMGWFSRQRSGSPDSGFGSVPPPLPQPFQALSDFAFRPSSTLLNHAAPARPAPRRGFIRRLLGRLPLKIRILLALPAAGALALAASLLTMMIYYTVTFPHPLAMRGKERAPVIRILARDGSVLAERGAAADYMPLDLLPRHVRGAVVATEDRRFYDHYGLDPIGLVRAFFTNLRAGRFAQGGSTLTQQLAKNLFLTPDRTISRKIEELGLALWLELRLSKADILELYLNRVYFGGGAYGIEAASQRYFDKSARELTIAEAALIAGLLKAPSKYSPAASPGAARARSRVVLAKMVEAGVIGVEDERRAIEERIVFYEPKSQREPTGVEYAIDFVLERLPPLLGAGHAEVVVETTLDANLQRRANEIVSKSLNKQGEALGVSQAAVAVLDTDGGIRALVGGRNYTESQFNRAVKARRQPGSAFKPLVYLAALEAGMTPDSAMYDLPLSIDGWAPRNDNGQYVGEITMRRALAQSVNTVAVRLNQALGSQKTAQAARRLGIKSDLREGPSLPLGTSEVTLLEMTGAYSVFANGGTAVEPHAIRRVRMSSGRVLFVRDVPRTAQIVDPLTVGAMNDMLNSALVSGTGKRAGIANHPAAGKTGTTQDFRDAWFVGYTSHLTAGVWIGNDSGKAMNRAMGGGLPAEIWRQLMAAAHDGKAPLALPGTTRQMPGTGDGQTAPEIAALSGYSQSQSTTLPTPRVGRIIETLPWLSGDATVQPRAPSLPALTDPHPMTIPGRVASELPPPRKLKVLPPPMVYPNERIDDDFIAKALAASDSETAPRVAASEAAKASRPKGMMSLGSWW
jgi:penicillin-binding protein 1A